MFAGPNGSGKSTLKTYLPKQLLGVYLNPDDIEKEIRTTGVFDFSSCQIQTTREDLLPHFTSSSLLNSAGFAEAARQLVFDNGLLRFGDIEINSYWASALVDFLRRKLLEQKTTFTFETVMSHPDKIEILAKAQALGYRTYLYYVATDDPSINVSRVHNRVKLGGHAVSDDKVIARYYRSLNLLAKAIKQTNRAYIFDNSGHSKDGKQTWLAEITDGTWLEFKIDDMPLWFVKAMA